MKALSIACQSYTFFLGCGSVRVLNVAAPWKAHSDASMSIWVSDCVSISKAYKKFGWQHWNFFSFLYWFHCCDQQCCCQVKEDKLFYLSPPFGFKIQNKNMMARMTISVMVGFGFHFFRFLLVTTHLIGWSTPPVWRLYIRWVAPRWPFSLSISCKFGAWEAPNLVLFVFHWVSFNLGLCYCEFKSISSSSMYFTSTHHL